LVCYIYLFFVSNLLDIITREMKLRNYSPKTIEAYTRVIKDIYAFFGRSPRDLSEEEIKNYLYAKQKQELSSQSIALFANALNYLYTQIYKRTGYNKIRHPKQSKRLPVILSREEIKKMIDLTQNFKHKLLLSTTYAAGLRVSEVVRLCVCDIDLNGLTITVQQGKGRKDRLTVISTALVSGLEQIMAGKEKNDYVFTSERRGRLTEASAQKVFYQALRRAGIKKNATFHSLCHSFATHLLENGVDVRYIQELLGHQNIRTTQIYTQVTNPGFKKITSPL